MAGTAGKGDEGLGSCCGSENNSECDDKVLPMAAAAAPSAVRRSTQLTWQMSTPVSQARAEMVPEIAAMYKSILHSLGENSSREGLLDTPLRAAKAMLFFTKVNSSLSGNCCICVAIALWSDSDFIIPQEYHFYQYVS